jgi:hypothetical protein
VSGTHVAAQRAVVRMLFDPAFAAAVRRAPDQALPDVAPALRAQLAALDDRALRLDRLRRLRALRTLAEELKASTTLALAETRSLGFLEEFFGSAAFHQCVEERGSMALAFAAFLAGAAADGRLRTPLYADVLAVESAVARARRAPELAARPPALDDPRARIATAPGVLAVEVNAGALELVQQAERYLFEVGLMPAVALCDDAPRLEPAPPTSNQRLHLVTVPHAGEVSLVTVDADTHALVRCLPAPRAVAAVLDEARARGVDRARALAVLRELADGELVVAAP